MTRCRVPVGYPAVAPPGFDLRGGTTRERGGGKDVKQKVFPGVHFPPVPNGSTLMALATVKKFLKIQSNPPNYANCYWAKLLPGVQ